MEESQTLIQALFRIVDPCTGKILIDGILSYSSMHKVHAFLNNHLCLPNFLDVIFELSILSDFYTEI